MVPFANVVFPIVGTMGLLAVEAISGFSPGAVGTIGVRPVIGVIGDMGVSIARFVPGIIEPIPMTNKHTSLNNSG